LDAIYFAKAEYTVEHILERLKEHDKPILLLDFQAVGFIDITGIDEARQLKEELEPRGIRLAFMNVHLPVRQVMESSGFLTQLRPGYLIENKGEAIAFLFGQLDQRFCKNICAYALFYECKTVK